MTSPIEQIQPNATGTTAVSARGLKKHYGSGETTVAALKNIDVDFASGEFTAIMGPSGSGKSTLMHCLAGLDSVDSGSIRIGDTEITGLSDTALTTLRRDRVGFIFQAFNLVPTLTAEQNITLPVSLARGAVDQDWFNSLTTTLGLSDRLSHRPYQLSGGQQQRVAVARALLTRPEVVFADEPTGNLDSKVGAEVLSMLRRSALEMGQSIIMVTHDPVAASYASRVVMLSDGELVGELNAPTPERVLEALSTLGA
ncbi:ABC transporter ATP-binding protein [Acaricomes phytoseiuli]|uniref:ABC transporter ATP-binding protein n=1 Tax=Acaricomes phytoseiuli TaxID=291968 RepID=UPI0003799A15|nr:ABC transporter ATP-binding protein [Acaricomes phytoseiuli]MCW1250465.1 ABC transporter ATP-binding protein [Acaricomes phytoseiuli]